MRKVSPEIAIEYLQKVEEVVPSVVVTLTKASMALKMGDPDGCKSELDSYAEVHPAGYVSTFVSRLLSSVPLCAMRVSREPGLLRKFCFPFRYTMGAKVVGGSQ